MTPGSAEAVERSWATGRTADDVAADRRLRRTAVVFAIAVTVHGIDHLRRGVDVLTALVTWAGTLQFVLAVVTLLLIHRRHRWAPPAAIAVGFASAVGFTAAHLLPEWSAFSDSFTGSDVAPNVTAFSWAAALFEIGADLALGWAGVRASGIYGRPDAGTASPSAASRPAGSDRPAAPGAPA